MGAPRGAGVSRVPAAVTYQTRSAYRTRCFACGAQNPVLLLTGREPAVCRSRRTPINVRKPSYNGLVFDGYQYYALAAAFANSSEAAYKLVDMCSRGKFVERDMAKAYQL